MNVLILIILGFLFVGSDSQAMMKVLFHNTAKLGCLAQVNELISKNVALDEYQKTLLHHAVIKNRADDVAILIKNKADVNAPDSNGNTPLHLAVIGNSPMQVSEEIAKILVENKADVNIANQSGTTPLHDAAFWGYPGIIKILIKYNASINARDLCKTTPLFLSALMGRFDATKMLLVYGADIRVLDNHGKTAIDVAKDDEIRGLIQNYFSFLAFYMASHKRLGENSTANVLPAELFGYIAKFVF